MLPAHRAGVLLHRLEQRGLRLRRRAVDLVGEQDIAEDRAFDECPFAMAGRQIFFDDVGAGDVGGHQVRRELDAPELQAERVGNGPHHQRLRRAGHAGQQAMAAHEERDEDLVEHFLLADDHFAHLLQNSLAHRMKALDALLQQRRILIQPGKRGHRIPFLICYQFVFCGDCCSSSNNFCAGR